MTLVRMILDYTLPLICIMGVGVIAAYLFKKPINRALPAGILGSVLIVYVLGFIDLRVGLWCIGLGVLVLVAMFVRRILSHKIDAKEISVWLKSNIVGEYLIAFLMLYTFFFVLNYNKLFYKWDDYSHWGMMAKECFRINRYYFLPDSMLSVHPEYPPFTTLCGYIWCKLCGYYKEQHLYNARLVIISVCMLSSLSVLFEKKEKVRIGERRFDRNSIVRIAFAVLMTISLALLPSLYDAAIFRTLYPEGVMIALTVYIIILLLDMDRKGKQDKLSIAIAAMALILTKQIAVYPFAMCILIYLLISLFTHRKRRETLEGLAVFLPAIPGLLLWKFVSGIYVTGGQFASSRFAPELIQEYLTGGAPEYKYNATILFLRKLVTVNLINSYLPLAFIGLFMLMIAATIGLYMGYNRYFPEAGITLGIALGMLGYISVTIILYMFGFSMEETGNIVCFERYMNTVCGVATIVLLLITIRICFEDRRRYIAAIIVAILPIIMCPVGRLKIEFTPGFFAENDEEVFYRDFDIIKDNTPNNSSIYIVNNGNESVNNMFTYYLTPRTISHEYINPDKYSVDEVIDYIKYYDYVFIVNAYEAFAEKYDTIFVSGNEKLNNQQLYKVITDGDDVRFERVN